MKKSIKKCMIVGGSNGIGLAFLNILHAKYDQMIVVDVVAPKIEFPNVECISFDLSKDDPAALADLLPECSALIVTAGIGRVTFFEKLSPQEIEKVIRVNLLSIAKIIRSYYDVLMGKQKRYCLVMGSLAGELSSPLFSVYSASKAGLNRMIESINIELKMKGTPNRITDVMPIAFAGSSFSGQETDLSLLDSLAHSCLDRMFHHETRFIPDEDGTCSSILARYYEDPHLFGLQSYVYKVNSGRADGRDPLKVGYLSGTFDLFHIGHLNLLRNAKRYCDCLIVGVHKSGAWKGKETFISFEERKEIVKSVRYVDEVYEAPDEDSDAWIIFKYDILFVGSDYKGTERFKRYEKYFRDKPVEIKYFPYTKGTSSTQLREALEKRKQ